MEHIMEDIPKIDLIAAAIAKAQATLSNVSKDKANPFFKSKYADLGSVIDAVRGPLADNDLAIVQTTEYVDGVTLLRTALIHKSGQSISGVYPIISTKQDPQGYGSAMTYARRYTIMAIVGVAAEDDDANAASAIPNAPRPQPVQTPVHVQAPAPVAPVTAPVVQPTKPKTGSWTIPLTGKKYDEWAKSFISKLEKCPDTPSYERLVGDNTETIMKIGEADLSLFEHVTKTAESTKLRLESKK
tara:strand:+ start:7753 stop:8481 length:729 start_codon:yes stop_codon:yes gene_type:complete